MSRIRLWATRYTTHMAPKTRKRNAGSEGRALTVFSSNKHTGAAEKPKSSKTPSVRPTHFLCLPLGQHPELRERIRAFHQKVLPSVSTAETTVIEGLDKSILVDPRRLHFTIGVMTLSSDDKLKSDVGDLPEARTLPEAIALLQALGPEINEIAREPVVLSLDKMGVLKTQRQQAGVLYIGPGDESNENTIKVNRIFDLVGQRFRQEGFIEGSARPSVLHCTLINASHRKPRRVPRTFSYREIFDHASVVANSSETSGVSLVHSGEVSRPAASLGAQTNRTVRVDFGEWAVSEIQLCKMGSHGPENEYMSYASLPFGGESQKY
ncbi:AKAP7 2'5' RNA ligase-like domain-containing protein [Mycena maculata]|uniref:AKAP7 2'5' RNA ligase-like domain-containing protein n=1 Tax=Mycena maculata TaxID=230809 RepID=A0AAD7IY22_9AGAR|nr:AKAP7 2'5' RNA ligase-like domain-containing protein [Mycena maculata]